MRSELVVGGGANAHMETVIGQDLQLLDVIDGFPAHDGMGAARVVADIAADRAILVGGRVRRESEAVFLGRVAELVVDNAGLHAREPCVGVDGQDAVKVFREVDNDGDVAGLAGQTRAAATPENRYVSFAAFFDGREHVLDTARNNHSDRNLPINREIGGIERTAAGVEPHLALYPARKRLARARPPNRAVRAAWRRSGEAG